MKKTLVIGLLLCLSVPPGCGGGKPNTGNSAPKAHDLSTDHPPTLEGAKAVLSEFLSKDAPGVKLLAQLKPTQDDLAAVYMPAFVEKATKAEDKLWPAALKTGGLRGKIDQTELQLFSATTRELSSWSDETRVAFGDDQNPDRFKKVPLYVLDGLTFYRFKFVKPGQNYGAVFDLLLVHANGRWLLIQNPATIIVHYDEIMRQ